MEFEATERLAAKADCRMLGGIAYGRHHTRPCMKVPLSRKTATMPLLTCPGPVLAGDADNLESHLAATR